MRVTNRMMMNNSIYHVNSNKQKIDDLYTKLASKKEIQRPSDDPVIAVRALRFRSTLSEIDQYLKKNIPDADAWLSCTDDAMGNITEVLGSITEYCNQAVNGYLDETNKNVILDNLQSMRTQIFRDANADSCGRTIFTGYKTDSFLTFNKDSDKKYMVTQKFQPDDIKDIQKIYNRVDISEYDSTNAGTIDVMQMPVPEFTSAHRIRLGYDKLLSEDGLKLTVTAPDGEYTAIAKSSTDNEAYRPGAGEVYYLADTGELIVGDDVYHDLMHAEGFSFTYTREGFQKGELDPTQYFDCVDITDPANPLSYTVENQEIYYEVNFGQTLKINTQGREVFTQDMSRDMDDIQNAVNLVIETQNKMTNLEKMYEAAEPGSDTRKKLDKVRELCQRELDFANENMTKAFEHGITLYKQHQEKVNLARADVGARQNRLEMNTDRLSSHRTVVELLKKENEEINVASVTIELSDAQSIYDASLSAASKVVQRRLIDFL